MDYFAPIELVGYLASLLVLISFLMKDVKKLRLISILGCSIFVIYGILLNYSIPIIFTNLTIIIINVVYLFKLKK